MNSIDIICKNIKRLSDVIEITPDMYTLSLIAPPFFLSAERLVYLMYFIEKEAEIIFEELDLVNGGFKTINNINSCMSNYMEFDLK